MATYRGVEIENNFGVISVMLDGRAFICASSKDARWLIQQCVSFGSYYYKDFISDWDETLERLHNFAFQPSVINADKICNEEFPKVWDDLQSHGCSITNEKGEHISVDSELGQRIIKQKEDEDIKQH